jgi:hypothetical protein
LVLQNELPGVRLQANPNQGEDRGFGFTDTNGNYVIGVTVGTWFLQPDDSLPGSIVQGANVVVATARPNGPISWQPLAMPICAAA